MNKQKVSYQLDKKIVDFIFKEKLNTNIFGFELYWY